MTAHDPAVALPLAPWIDHVWLKADGGDQARPGVAAQFAAAGVRVANWHSWDDPPPALSWAAETAVGQAEGPGQAASCVVHEMRAVITNVTFTDNAWLSRYEAVFTECYQSVNPAATPPAMEFEAVKRGAKFVVPTFAVYDGSSEIAGGRKVPLSEYLTRWSCDNFAVYTVEYMQPEDIEALKNWRKDHPK